MLKDRVETHDGDLCGIECARDALGLGDAILDTAWAEHLEGVQGDDTTAKIRKRKRPVTIEPMVDLPFRRGSWFGLAHLHFR
jgi:hypothetical protein